MNEVRHIAAHGPTADEMQKLHNQLINDVVRLRQSSQSRAQNISEYALYDGDPTLVNSELETLMAVTPEQIRSTVSEYLDSDNRSLLDVTPVGKG
jgi:predicted Zn-dependent peptidase